MRQEANKYNNIISISCIVLLVINYLFQKELFMTETNAGYGLVAVWINSNIINSIICFGLLLFLFLGNKKLKNFKSVYTFLNLILIILTLIVPIYLIPKIL